MTMSRLVGSVLAALAALLPHDSLACTLTTKVYTQTTPLVVSGANAGTEFTSALPGINGSYGDVYKMVVVVSLTSTDEDASRLYLNLEGPSGEEVGLFRYPSGAGASSLDGTWFFETADPTSSIPYSGVPLILTDYTWSGTASSLTPQ